MVVTESSGRRISGYPPVLVEIRAVEWLPKQVGLFAVRRITAGVVVGAGNATGESSLMPESVWSSLDPITKKRVYDYCLWTPRGFVVPDDLNNVPTIWYINHSCRPNVGFNGKGDFVAIRDIGVDEELCFDYAFAGLPPDFEMTCRCGSPDCRSVVRRSDWLDPVFRMRNHKHMLAADWWERERLRVIRPEADTGGLEKRGKKGVGDN